MVKYKKFLQMPLHTLNGIKVRLSSGEVGRVKEFVK